MLNQKHPTTTTFFNASHIDTPLGNMIAIADEKALYLLEFTNQKNVEQTIQQLCIATQSTIVPGNNHILDLVTKELTLYFAGTLKNFTIPVHFVGTAFQHKAWHALTTVAYGHTRSYAQQAILVGNKNACRAVARANSTNTIAIVIPCHRIISSSGKLSGYAGGIERKQWLINHEKTNTY